MKSDKNIRQYILKAFEANPLLLGAKIDVEVNNSEVRLLGTADKFCMKAIARKTAKEIAGVRTVADEIVIIINDEDKISDSEIESRIIEIFRKNFGNTHNAIKTIVKDGYVWIEGRMKWKYQKDLAEECIRCVEGIKNINNNIFVPDSVETGIDEKDVLAAIYSDHSIKSDIKTEIVGNRVILKGIVENMDQKHLVTRLVRNVPGVREIENFLVAQQL